MLFITSKISDGNMSIFCGDINRAIENKINFFNRNSIVLEKVVELHQIHGNKIIHITKIPNKIIKADGLITNLPNIYLMIKAADCHQIGLYDPKNKAIGLIHAGYKGLEKEIIKKVVFQMQQTFKSHPQDLKVEFGPSIGPCHYRLDIWKKAEDQLIESGVLKRNIHNPKVCTYESNDYFSHRRAQDINHPDYRFATILGINNQQYG